MTMNVIVDQHFKNKTKELCFEGVGVSFHGLHFTLQHTLFSLILCMYCY